ncbi:hypothetical protein ADJ79_12130 [Ottowia sp. oral taxon 894]|uniref:hypothetical protein n=1 Tax=Ottowia sp. oral taxon 894 TaxID=1658672 RepID=UPI0006826385|nr:hypothetical protein [Ottowia sp. oral taxon 894]AKU67780.1 hypothetical protein ADJ79_12130 [Ottowia sp. oral taxon 894]
MTNRIQLPLTVRVLAAKQAAAFLEDISGMNAVVVATEDGFDIASAMKTGDAARIAALARAPFPPSAPWFRKKPAWAQTSA